MPLRLVFVPYIMCSNLFLYRHLVFYGASTRYPVFSFVGILAKGISIFLSIFKGILTSHFYRRGGIWETCFPVPPSASLFLHKTRKFASVGVLSAVFYPPCVVYYHGLRNYSARVLVVEMQNCNKARIISISISILFIGIAPFSVLQ
jgi:hypothetical protein